MTENSKDRAATERLYSDYAENFARKIGGLNNYDDYYTKFVEECRGDEKLLDLACGPGNASGFMHSLKPGIEVTFVDFSQKMLELAKARVPAAKTYKSDIVSPNIPEVPYDLIICSFGLPYLTTEELTPFIEGLKPFTQKGTRLYISCMKGDMSRLENMSFAGEERIRVNYHSRERLGELFGAAGFSESFYDEIDFKEPDGSIIRDMIIFYKQGS